MNKKLLKTKLSNIRSLVTVGMIASSAQIHAQQTPEISNSFKIDLVITDEQGQGFYEQTPYTLEGYPFETIGDARQYAIKRTARAIEHSFNSLADTRWDVGVRDLDGFLAITFGPSFGVVTEYDAQSLPPKFEVGRSYPTILTRAYTGAQRGTYIDSNDRIEESSIVFDMPEDYFDFVGDESSGKHMFMATALHEALHAMGFSNTHCPENCSVLIGERTPFESRDSISQFLRYLDDNTSIEYDDLTLAQSVQAHKSQRNLVFLGTQATQDEAIATLTDGLTNGGIHMHAELDTDGSLDSQNLSHFAPHMQPSQLMQSRGANTLDMGMAAYVLCDIGWCREHSQVIDMSVETILPEQMINDEIFTIEYRISSDAGKAIDDASFNLSIDQALSIVSMISEDNRCQLNEYEIDCERLSFTPSEEYVIKLEVQGTTGTYVLKGGVKSNEFDVDRRPFNNLTDDFVTITNRVETPPTNTETPTPTTPTSVPVTPSNENESGGSISAISLLGLLFVSLVARRAKKHPKDKKWTKTI